MNSVCLRYSAPRKLDRWGGRHGIRAASPRAVYSRSHSVGFLFGGLRVSCSPSSATRRAEVFHSHRLSACQPSAPEKSLRISA